MVKSPGIILTLRCWEKTATQEDSRQSPVLGPWHQRSHEQGFASSFSWMAASQPPFAMSSYPKWIDEVNTTTVPLAPRAPEETWYQRQPPAPSPFTTLFSPQPTASFSWFSCAAPDQSQFTPAPPPTLTHITPPPSYSPYAPPYQLYSPPSYPPYPPPPGYPTRHNTPPQPSPNLGWPPDSSNMPTPPRQPHDRL